ncbi:MarR family transcriptional regulator [Neosynechococcus sphagnicola sy1]|uniref:MarR family transcriptional regulator n=1 Tax=Neosynechococcus sphagnicola sy1 TaxID=1497020 RepID=A0A098TKM2_9CYAN|nr:MarR family transcriptional regulator [Neosynechococcus sphagnicola]KGF72831.1 MarR family transcriptional regulator [Neosynechococcus sphagnicola sy1]
MVTAAALPPELQLVLAPHSIGYRLKLLSQLLSRKFQDRLDPLGLTPFHWVVLCCLWQEDGLATCQIADQLRQVGGTITGVLDRMEDRGFIYRQRDLQDRRVWRVWLTAMGQELQQVLPPIALGVQEEVLQGMTPQDRAEISRLLDLLIANCA